MLGSNRSGIILLRMDHRLPPPTSSGIVSPLDATLLLLFPLSLCQVKGKAAIDGLGSRLGKSGASFLQQWLIVLFGSILKAAPVVAGAPTTPSTVGGGYAKGFR